MGSANFIARADSLRCRLGDLERPRRGPWLSRIRSASVCMDGKRSVAGVPLSGHPDPHDAKRRRPSDPAARELLNLELSILSEQKIAKVVALLEELRQDSPHLHDRVDELAEAMSQPADPSVGDRRNQGIAIRVRPTCRALKACRRIQRPGSVCSRAATKSSAKAGTSRPAIFAGSYLALAIGRISGLRSTRRASHGRRRPDGFNRRLAAQRREGGRSETIALLLGMMIVVASLRRSGFFAFATVWVMARAKHSGFDRQSHCREARGGVRSDDRLRGLFPCRRAADADHACDRRALAFVVISGFETTFGRRVVACAEPAPLSSFRACSDNFPMLVSSSVLARCSYSHPAGYRNGLSPKSPA